MVKHLLLKSILLLCALVAGSTCGWADTYSLTPDQASTGSNAASYITTLTEFTYSGIKWKMNQWNPKTLQVKTNQSSAASEFRFYNTSAFAGKITQVVITFSSLEVSDASKLRFKGGTSEVSATTGGTAGTWNATAKTLTWTPSASDNFTYFAFYQDGKAASGTNYLATTNAIVVTYTTTDPGKTTPVLSFPEASYSADVSDGFTAPTLSNASGVSVVYSSTNADAATVANDGTVTLVAEGETTISAYFAGNETYNSAEASYTLTVTDRRVDANIAFAEATQTTTIGEAYTGQALTNTSSLPITYSSTNENVATVAANGTVTVLAAGSTDIKASFAGNATYKPAVVSYTLTVNKKDAGLAWSATTAEALLGTPFVAPTLSNPNGLIVTYESLKPAVATISNTGVVSILGEGTVTIKATFAGNDEYNALAVSYSLTVVDPDKIIVNFNNNDQGITGDFEQDALLSYNIKGVDFEFKQTGTETKPRVDGNYSDKVARVYNGNTLTITAPVGINFKSIEFNFKKGSLKIGGVTYNSSNKKWVDDAHSVTFTGAETTFINSIIIYYNIEKITITSAGYATYYSESALDFSGVDGLTASIITGNTGNTLTLQNVESVPANTGVVLSGAPNTYSVPVVASSATNVSGNKLKGVTTATVKDAGTIYVLMNDTQGVGFYKNTYDFTVGAHTAYLLATDVSEARSFFSFDETSSVNEELRMKNEESAAAQIYDLQGRRMASSMFNVQSSMLKKGLYIVNGKKYIVK